MAKWEKVYAGVRVEPDELDHVRFALVAVVDSGRTYACEQFVEIDELKVNPRRYQEVLDELVEWMKEREAEDAE